MLMYIVGGVYLLAMLGVALWLIATWPRMRREMEVSRAESRRVAARIAAIAAEALGRPRP